MKRKVIIFGILFLVIFITLAIIIRNKVKKYGLHIKDIPTAISVKFSHKQCAFNTMGGGIIAHAGGGIISEGKTYAYSNSKEALLQSIDEGFRFIELDLMLQANGDIFAAHDYKHFYSITNQPQSILPPNKNQISNAKIFGKFTPLEKDDINEIFLANPQIYLVTDKLNDFKAIKEQLHFQDRILVEVFGLGAYYEAIRQGIHYPMLSSGNFKLASKLGIPMLATHTSSLNDENKRKLAERYIANGGCIAVFSSNNETFIRDNLGKRATMIYADYWDMKNQQCKLEESQCKTY